MCIHVYHPGKPLCVFYTLVCQSPRQYHKGFSILTLMVASLLGYTVHSAKVCLWVLSKAKAPCTHLFIWGWGLTMLLRVDLETTGWSDPPVSD